MGRSPRHPGRFLVLEGCDGAGKSTHAGLLRDRLQALGREVLLLREPGGTEVGERVRAILLDPALKGMDVRTELCLFMACRAQLVATVIEPALQRGAVVVCDRFLYSTIVYQGIAGGLPEEDIRAVARVAVGGLEPDRIVVLDVPVAETMTRTGGGRDRMELKGEAFLRRVREGYLQLASGDPTAVVVDATQPREIVARHVWEHVREDV